MQFPSQRAHERVESRHRSNSRAPDEPDEISEIVLRTDQTVADFGSVLFGRSQCGFEEVQANGCQNLRLSLML